MTQAQRRAATRARLIDASAVVFARRGFAAASVEEITATAGLSRGAFYAHFDAKEDLLMSVLEQMTANLDEFIRSTLEADASLHGLMTGLKGVRAGNSRGDRQWLLLYGELRQQALRDPVVQGKLVDHYQRVLDVLCGLIDTNAALLGVSLPVPTLTLARLLLAIDEGLSFLRSVDPTIPDDAFIDAIALMTRAVTARESTDQART